MRSKPLGHFLATKISRGTVTNNEGCLTLVVGLGVRRGSELHNPPSTEDEFVAQEADNSDQSWDYRRPRVVSGEADQFESALRVDPDRWPIA